MQKQPQISLLATKHPKIFNVVLKLGFEKRFIGNIDYSNDGAFITARKEKHLHRLTKSFGINTELLHNHDIEFKWIIIEYDGKKLITTREYFKAHSIVFQFNGFEKQSFLAINLFGIEKAKKFDKSRGTQLGFFDEGATA